jgi:hypothetical protein
LNHPHLEPAAAHQLRQLLTTTALPNQLVMIPTIERQLNDTVESLTTRKYTLIRSAAQAYSVNQITLARRLRGGCSIQESQKSRLLLLTEQEILLIR